MLSAEPKAEADDTETLIIQDITKTESDYCFIVHCFEENNDKHTVERGTWIDIVIWNHTLRAQPTDQAVIC